MGEHVVFPGSANATMTVSESSTSITSNVAGGAAYQTMNNVFGGNIISAAGDVMTWMNAGTHRYQNTAGSVRFEMNGMDMAMAQVCGNLRLSMSDPLDRLCAGSFDSTVEVCVRASHRQIIVTVGPIDCIFDGNDGSISILIFNAFGVKFISGAITFIFNAGGGPCVNMKAVADFFKALKDLNFDSVLPGIGDFLDPVMECP